MKLNRQYNVQHERIDGKSIQVSEYRGKVVSIESIFVRQAHGLPIQREHGLDHNEP